METTHIALESASFSSGKQNIFRKSSFGPVFYDKLISGLEP